MAEWSLAPPTQPGSQGMAAGACWIGRHGQKVEGKSEETLASRAGTTRGIQPCIDSNVRAFNCLSYSAWRLENTRQAGSISMQIIKQKKDRVEKIKLSIIYTIEAL